MTMLHSSNGSVKPVEDDGIRIFVSPYTYQEMVEAGRKADDILLKPLPTEKPGPMLVNGVAYATLTIPDPKGKGADKTYRVYPVWEHGRKVPGRVKLWRREPDGTTTAYRVERDEDGVILCTCPAGLYGRPCKHARAADELGIV